VPAALASTVSSLAEKDVQATEAIVLSPAKDADIRSALPPLISAWLAQMPRAATDARPSPL